VTFDAFMESALYDPDSGFFSTGRGAGRAGADFLTSPEVGSLFGACVARAIDRAWTDSGAPDPFLVVEAGAGRGRLAREVQRAEPACLPALRYVLVERSPLLRAEQRALLPIEPADEALGPFTRRARDELDEGDELTPVDASGPVFASLPELPEMPVASVVFANELLDNLPFGIAAWDGRRWNEVRITLDGTTFVELTVPATEADAAMLDAVVAGAVETLPSGARLPIPRGLEAWLDECSGALHRGVVILVDYIAGVDEIVTRGNGWLRGYRGQRRLVDVLTEPGEHDITGDVVREQLVHLARAAGFVVVREQSQAAWLDELGIDALVAEGRHAWEAGAARGDLTALAGRSRVHEAEALTDPSGLGAHRVVVLQRR
jgi:NADH dehydrogenase [ubiquinone] 1 alpha subcomplex assembly factor 7